MTSYKSLKTKKDRRCSGRDDERAIGLSDAWESMTAARPEWPPDWPVVLGQALRQAEDASWTVALQCRRLKSDAAGEARRGLRLRADLQMLLIALRRLRRSAELAALAPEARDELSIAIAAFDRPLPDLWRLEDMETLFERAPVAIADDWSGPIIPLPGGVLNIDDALDCSDALLTAITTRCQ